MPISTLQLWTNHWQIDWTLGLQAEMEPNSYGFLTPSCLVDIPIWEGSQISHFRSIINRFPIISYLFVIVVNSFLFMRDSDFSTINDNDHRFV